MYCTLSLLETPHFAVELLRITYISLPETTGQQQFLFAIFPSCLLASQFVIETLFGCLLLSSSFLQYMTLQIIQLPVALLHQCAIEKRHMAHCRVIKSQSYLHSCHRHANKHNLFFPTSVFSFTFTTPSSFYLTLLCIVFLADKQWNNSRRACVISYGLHSPKVKLMANLHWLQKCQDYSICSADTISEHHIIRISIVLKPLKMSLHPCNSMSPLDPILRVVLGVNLRQFQALAPSWEKKKCVSIEK